MQIGRGFYTWLENTRETNQKKRTMKKTLLYWTKLQLQKAFRTWVDNDHKAVQGQLDMCLQTKHEERRNLRHQGEELSMQ